MKILPTIILLLTAFSHGISAQIVVTTTTVAEVESYASTSYVFNAEFYPDFDSSQISVGERLAGVEDTDQTSWADSPSSNTISVELDVVNNLTASANGSAGALDQVTAPFNTIFIYVVVDGPLEFASDFIEVSTLTVNGDDLPVLSVSGGNGSEAIKIQYIGDQNIAPFDIAGVISKQFGLQSGKSWLIKIIGANTPHPDDQVPPPPQPSVSNVSIASNAVEMTWTAESNYTWTVESIQDLSETNWIPASGDIISTNGLINFSTNSPAEQIFYRLMYQGE